MDARSCLRRVLYGRGRLGRRGCARLAAVLLVPASLLGALWLLPGPPRAGSADVAQPFDAEGDPALAWQNPGWYYARTDRRALATLRASRVERFRVSAFRAWDGRPERVVLLWPAAAAAGVRLPVIVVAHARGGTGPVACAPWRSYAAEADVVVICPDGRGRSIPRYSWGWRGQVDDLARMPRIAARLSGGRADPQEAYITGFSMGGQETLLAVAAHPYEFRAALALDPATDMVQRYADIVAHHDPTVDAMKREYGGTPATAPLAYSARSPLDQAAALARSTTRIAIWGSRTDQRIHAAARTQVAPLAARLSKLRRHATVEIRIGAWSHGALYFTRLDAVLAFFGLGGRPVPPVPASCLRLAGPVTTALVLAARPHRAGEACDATTRAWVLHETARRRAPGPSGRFAAALPVVHP